MLQLVGLFVGLFALIWFCCLGLLFGWVGAGWFWCLFVGLGGVGLVGYCVGVLRVCWLYLLSWYLLFCG